jgi:Ca-activated chloride channel family protein
MKTWWTNAVLLVFAFSMGCASNESSRVARGSRTVGQGGAQDIGQFRAIVERGEVPTRDVLDPVGFFAEHAVDAPPADCGERVCLQPQLAVAPRFDGSNWTMGFVALNSPIDPAREARPPTHVVLAIEATSRTESSIERMLPAAVRALVEALRPDDRVSIVRIGARAEALVVMAEPTDPMVDNAVRVIARGVVDGTAATYGGLAIAGRTLDDWEGARRIVLLTSGRADAGLRDESRVVELAEALGRERIAISVIGMGADYVQRLPAAIGELGTGSYYFAENEDALVEILGMEGRTSLVPLATNFTMRITAARGYTMGRIYGARRVSSDRTTATLSSPMLVLGQREGADDVEHGRRGGGGGIFIELMADPSAGIDAGAPALIVSACFIDALSGELRTLERTVVNALAPGQNPPGALWPVFSNEEYAKPFMMLNMYLALRGTLEFYESGDCARALGLPEMLQTTVELWQGNFHDPDVWADHELLLDLSENIRVACENAAASVIEPIPPTSFGGGCFAD